MQIIKVKRGTAAAWAVENPILAYGEPGWDATGQVFKVGDGVTPWSLLPGTKHAISEIIGLQTELDTLSAAILAVVDGAPANLNTLNEIAAAIGDDPAFSVTVLSLIDGKSAIGHGHAISDTTGLQGALDAKLASSEVGTSVAPLVAGQIPAGYLPSYVDDVLEYADEASFPATGELGKIYVAINNPPTVKSTIHRWSGTAYIELVASPGSTDAVPEGATNLYFTAARVRDTLLTGLSTAVNEAITAADSILVAAGKIQAQITANLATLTSHTGNTSNPHSVTKAQVGLGSADNTSDADKPVSTATQSALNGKSDTGHGHAISDVTGLSAALSGKSDTTHYHDSLKAVLTVGENVAAGDLCYFKTADSKWWKASASAEATAKGKLVLALASISADASGECLERGRFTTTGLTVGVQYLAETAGTLSATAPSGTGKIVRQVGTAESTTVLYFDPDASYLELA